MKINLNRLREELRKVPAFEPPKKSEGYGYLYELLYLPFMQGSEISLGALDFEAFSLEDVRELDMDYYNTFSRRLNQNDGIKSRLRKTEPLPSAVPFL